MEFIQILLMIIATTLMFKLVFSYDLKKYDTVHILLLIIAITLAICTILLMLSTISMMAIFSFMKLVLYLV